MRLGDLGNLLFVPAVLAGASAAGVWLFGEGVVALGLLGAAALAFLAGVQCRRTAAPSRLETRADAYRTVAVGWLLVSALGGVPFLLAAWLAPADAGSWVVAFRDPWNALFEGVSGITSTGLSVVPSAAELPAGLQWWRSLMEWVGGLGIVLLVTALVVDVDDPQRDRADAKRTEDLHRAEFGSEFRQRAAQASRQVLAAYVPLTLAAVLLFAAVGMPWWHAVNHGMTAISTGGFTITDDSFASYGEVVRLVAALPMLVGAISFTVLLRLLRMGDPRRLRRDHVLHLFLGSIVLLVVLVAWLGAASMRLAFDALSALTTTGFHAGAEGRALPCVVLLLTTAMFVGGMRGSTAGGWKVDRLLRLGHGLFRRLRAVVRRERGDSEPSGRVSRARPGRLLMAWSFALLLGAVALHLGNGGAGSFLDALFESSSALSTVGLSQGITGPELVWHSKLVLILLMWLGRLEILPVVLLVLVAPRQRGVASGC